MTLRKKKRRATTSNEPRTKWRSTHRRRGVDPHQLVRPPDFRDEDVQLWLLNGTNIARKNGMSADAGAHGGTQRPAPRRSRRRLTAVGGNTRRPHPRRACVRVCGAPDAARPVHRHWLRGSCPWKNHFIIFNSFFRWCQFDMFSFVYNWYI